MKVTLTFDNGPDTTVTPHVLDVLDHHGISATFFVLGHKLEDPDARSIVERARAAGHWIGNHTWSHETPLGALDDTERSVSEIRDTQEIMGHLSHERRFFRPFGGGGQLDDRLLSPASQEYLEREAFTVVLWNSVPGDWRDPTGWVETALEQIAQQEWSVVVLHDMPTDGAMDRLDDFIVEAKALGAEFVQDIPAELTPMRRGVSSPELSSFVSAE